MTKERPFNIFEASCKAVNHQETQHRLDQNCIKAYLSQAQMMILTSAIAQELGKRCKFNRVRSRMVGCKVSKLFQRRKYMSVQKWYSSFLLHPQSHRARFLGPLTAPTYTAIVGTLPCSTCPIIQYVCYLCTWTTSNPSINPFGRPAAAIRRAIWVARRDFDTISQLGGGKFLILITQNSEHYEPTNLKFL